MSSDQMAWKQPDIVCAGCDLLVPGADVGLVWIHGALGISVARTHRDHGCAAVAVQRHAEQPAMRISEPLTDKERLARENAA